MNTEKIKKLAEKANDYYISQNPECGDCAWQKGAYFIGCMAAYRITGKQSYLDYAFKWAKENNWSFYDDGKDWAYKNADYKICGQTYLELLKIDPNAGTMQHMLDGMEIVLNDADNDYWWWIDTIYMALPFYHMMGVEMNDSRYFEKVYKLFCNTAYERKLYDTKEHMWFRDENYLFEKKQTPSGKKIFWGRGNGWVIGGIARTLAVLPKDNPHYKEYETIFRDMSEALVKWQMSDGFWRCSIIEPSQYNVPETSGTVLISYALALGIRLGILEKDVYMPYVTKAFEGLSTIALDENGRLGYVQGVAGWPGPVEKETTMDYAVGTYLLLCEELIKLKKEQEQS